MRISRVGIPVLWCTLFASAAAPPLDERRIYLEGSRRFSAGEIAHARTLFEQGYYEATRRGDSASAARFLAAIGSADFVRLRYRQALAAYDRSSRIAGAQLDPATRATVLYNSAVIYGQMGQVDLSLAAARKALHLLPDVYVGVLRPTLNLALAGLSYRKGDIASAVALLDTAITQASAIGHVESEIAGWDGLGTALLASGRLDAAEPAFIEAYRLRRLLRPQGFEVAFRNLAALRLAQGDAAAALRFADLAMAIAARQPPRVPAATISYQRARALHRLGRLQEALAEYERALALAGAWRAELPPADAVLTSAEFETRLLYENYIRAGMELYQSKPAPDLAWRIFSAAGEARGRAFAARLHLERTLPPEYWEKLARFRALQPQRLLAPAGSPNSPEYDRLLLDLTRIESRAGIAARRPPSLASSGLSLSIAKEIPESIPRGNPLSLVQFQKSVPAGEALLSFYLAEARSYVWTITRERFQVHFLPGRGAIRAAVHRFRAAIAAGSPDFPTAAREFYRMLLSGPASVAAACPHWVIVPDDSLHELPFAALVASPAGAPPVYLAEQRVLRLVPAAALPSVPAANLPGPFIGYGDPIYNHADPRLPTTPPPAPRWSFFGFAAADPPSAPLDLARIPGSGREIARAAAAWGGPAECVLLSGAQARRGRLAAALARRPAVLHLATHVVHPPGDPSRALLALGFDEQRHPDFLSALGIAAFRSAPSLVVMSGCSSGRGRVLPGVGMIDLSRAWLQAGAGAVAAAYWPISDDGGRLFAAFYQALRRRPGPLSARAAAAALRDAQLRMLRSGTWRSRPAHWAALFLAARN